MKRTQAILVTLCLALGVGLVLLPDRVADAANRVRMFTSHGHSNHRSVIASTRHGDVVVASGRVTRSKDLHRVAEDCGPSYEAFGICVRAPKHADLKCVTTGWSRKHGCRETFHFSNGDNIHIHEDGLIDHDD